ncbi:MAG: UPF0149 family protein [Halofilum sp. (in: g-proteobacteria)]
MSLPDRQEVHDALDDRGAPISAAESHGLLCGLLCMRAENARITWIRRTFDDAEATEPPAPLDRLHDETLRQLDDTEFEFQLMLPDDEELDLAGRTAALADWCNGFAFGVGASGRDEDSLASESREFLYDVARIAEAVAEGEDDDEAAFAEVVEYVRMGVLLTRTETDSGR